MMEKESAKLENPPMSRKSCCAYPRRDSSCASWSRCCAGSIAKLYLASEEADMALTLTPPSVRQGGEIPRQFACEGPDRAPALSWSGAPGGTKSLALIVDDPDAPDPAAPRMVYVHWVVYGLPPSSSGLPEGGQLPAA